MDAYGSAVSGERSFSLEEAWQKAHDTLAEIGLTADFIKLDGDPGACRCELRRGTDQLGGIPGTGKGHGFMARVGSVYEAIEHQFLDGFLFDDKKLSLVPAHRVAAQPALSADGAVALLKDGDDTSLSCLEYEALHDASRIQVPLFLSSVWWTEGESELRRRRLGDNYNYGSVGRYASNNGSAIGANVTEATVHAINEVIERDALSLIALRGFLSPDPVLATIDPQTLPMDLQELLSYAEQVVGDRVYLIDMTTDNGVPVTLAYVAPGPDGAYWRGTGASLSTTYSVYRALTELLQIFQVAAREGTTIVPSTHLVRNYPKLVACAEFNLTEALSRAETVPFVRSDSLEGPEAHLKALMEALHARGLEVYRHVTHTFDSGVSVVQILIPGLERFMLTLKGQFVLPGLRGKSFMAGLASR
ncbi:YcaO-like family protein [Streptomyces regalis]|uniref:YcaO domain-containing protein n=1 Tax=Streptomyces regalis TaxID=68262 RepID=A0A0X3UZC2_9ACTN|nr:YcaO-like family protein [Streptomyces regalis]KUL37850.1 hypothetical protein ADL12_18000 [Streptomyces regalis]